MTDEEDIYPDWDDDDNIPDQYPDWDDDDPYDYELDNRQRLATEQVPWRRESVPGFKKRDDSYKWGPHIVNIGPNARDRLLSDKRMIEYGQPIGAHERAYAIMWDYWNNRGGSSIQLYQILAAPQVKYGEPPKPSVLAMIRDDYDDKLVQYAAQAIIQWLGTNVGSCFVQEAIKLGDNDYERIRRIVKKNPHRSAVEEEIQKRVNSKINELIPGIENSVFRDFDEKLKEKIQLHEEQKENQRLEGLREAENYGSRKLEL